MATVQVPFLLVLLVSALMVLSAWLVIIRLIRLRGTVRKAEQEIVWKAGQYNLLQNSFQQLEAKHARLQEDVNPSKEQSTKTKQDNERLEAQARRVESSSLQLRHDLGLAQQQRQKAEQERKDLDTKLRQFDAERLKLHEHLQKSLEENGRIEAERTRLAEEVHRLQAECAALQSRHEEGLRPTHAPARGDGGQAPA